MKEECACKSCGHIGEVDGGLRGSFFVELTMWSFILPGPFYSIWRRMERKRCRRCTGHSLVSLKSVEGKALLEKFYLENLRKK